MEFIVVLVIAVLVALALRYRRRADGHPHIPEQPRDRRNPPPDRPATGPT